MNKKLLSALTIALCLALLLAGCSSSSSQNSYTGGYDSVASTAPASAFAYTSNEKMADSMSYGEIVETEMAVSDDADTGLLSASIAQSLLPVGRKIITSFNISAETTDFDSSVLFIPASVVEHGGYIEYSSVSGRSINDGKGYNTRLAVFTLRIPSDKIHSFVAKLSEHYNIVRTEESSTDITDSYYDNASRLKALEDQEKQLISLLEKGDELQYLLEVQREIANVRYQIEDIHSRLQRMDQSVNYSTVTIDLLEVMVYQQIDPVPMTFGERVGMAVSDSIRSFVRSSQDSFVWFIHDLPYHISNIVVFAIIWLVARIIIRKVRGLKKGERTFSRKPNTEAAQPAVTPAPTKPETTPADNK